MKIAPHLLTCHGSEVLLNFPLFRSFQIGSIAQNKNPETSEISFFKKSLNFICQTLKRFA